MYVIVPLDIIPDFIPFIGQVDDSYLLAISILRLFNRADRRMVMEHWKGQRDIKEIVDSIVRIAEFFLPNPIKNVLRGRIEPKGRLSVIADAPARTSNRRPTSQPFSVCGYLSRLEVPSASCRESRQTNR